MTFQTFEEEQRFKEIVREAVASAFADIGLHADERDEQRKDFAHLRRARRAFDKVESVTITTATRWVVLIILAGIALGFKDTFLSWIHQSPR